MISQTVKQSPIFQEFSSEEAQKHFGLCEKKVSSHVDTLYYSVFVREDSNLCSEEMQELLDRLRAAREQKSSCYSLYVDFFGLSVEKIRFANYDFCLSESEMFDIFISSVLPNPYTPRIVVQLRTRTLVLDGVCQSICKSYRRVETILESFGLEIERVQENRIDYAYHTNLIQSPYKFFSDRMLLSKLKSKMRLYHKVGEIGKTVEIDYISFGQRKSNDVFVRIYNKSREVIEKNYKSFFLQKWLSDGLINAYDHYVYTKAYELGAYVTGILVGRIEWYLENGKNEDIKNELSRAMVSCYINSDNTDVLRQIVDKYLPPVTLIMNVEFQTKRKFYSSLDEWISNFGNVVSTELGQRTFLDFDDYPIQRLFVLYSLRSEICKYLTENTVAFVDNKGTDNERPAYWWSRIHDVTMDEYSIEFLKLWRLHERHSDREKSKNRMLGTVATHSILSKKDFNEKNSFQEDISDILSTMNDNDVFDQYQVIKKRKARQLKSILKNEGEITE